MVAQLFARQSKRLCGHQHFGSKSAASQLLAIATMAFEHGDWLGGAFVTNRAASAAAGKWDFHKVCLVYFLFIGMCAHRAISLVNIFLRRKLSRWTPLTRG